MDVNAAFHHRRKGAPGIPIPEIVDRLTGHIAALCEHLLPNGRRDGPEWRVGSVDGEAGQSMSVRLNGAKCGIWCDFAEGSKGDPLDLIAACLRLDKGQAVKWAKSWLGIEKNDSLSSLRLPPRPQHKEAPHQDNPNGALARAIWDQSRPAAGTPVETYLKFRGINIPAPATLQYHAGLKYAPSGLLLPCMVAAIQAPDRSITAIHRTFIRDDGQGKAPVAKSRMMLGSVNGGCVRLAHVGGPKMIVAEGIETALAVLEATGLPTWAALSTSGLRSIILPPEVETVIIAADGDKAGEEAAQAAARRFIAEGRVVKIARPPRGMDFNDLLRMPEGVAFISDQRRRTKANG